MNLKELSLARKYAIAFLNVYQKEFTFAHYTAVMAAGKKIADNRELRAYFTLTLPHETQKKIALFLCQQLQLPPFFNRLLVVLIENHHQYLMSTVCNYIAQLYRERNNIMRFTCTSAQALDAQELVAVEKFLQGQTNASIELVSLVDKKLLAGIRIENNEFLWDNSLQSRLAYVQRLLHIRN